MASKRRAAGARPSQFGRTVIGFVVGVLTGLGVSLAVAVYVTKVPVPFLNKVQQRTSEQDAQELERNRDWNPNAPLQGQVTPPPGLVPTPGGVPAPGARDPGAILGGAVGPGQMPVPPGIAFYVQAGAFQRVGDAEQQRARLGMMGFAAQISEREQSGRTMFRVRVGPYDKRQEAETLRDRLGREGIEAALVRVEQ